MSLLLDALKQAELAKSQTGTKGDGDRREPRMDRASGEGASTLEPVDFKNDLPLDSPTSTQQPLPEALDPGRAKLERRESAATTARRSAQRQAAQLFAAKTDGRSSRDRVRLVLYGVVAVLALTVGGMYLRDFLMPSLPQHPLPPLSLGHTPGPGNGVAAAGAPAATAGDAVPARGAPVSPAGVPSATSGASDLPTGVAAPSGPATATGPMPSNAMSAAPRPATPNAAAPGATAATSAAANATGATAGTSPPAAAPSAVPAATSPAATSPAATARAGAAALAPPVAVGTVAGAAAVQAAPAAAAPAAVPNPSPNAPSAPAQPAARAKPGAAPPMLVEGTDDPLPPIKALPPRTPAAALPPPGRAPRSLASPPRRLPSAAPASVGDTGTVTIGGDNTIRVKPQSGPVALDPALLEGYTALVGGDYPIAKRAYDQAAANDPSNVDALLGLATVAAATGDRSVALRHYRRVLELDPGNATAMAGLAATRGASGTPGDESALRSEIAQRPDPALHFALGNEFAAQARWADAQQAYFDAYRLDGANPDYAYNLAVALDQLDQSEPALTYYRKAEELARKRGAHFDKAALRSRIAQLEH